MGYRISYKKHVLAKYPKARCIQTGLRRYSLYLDGVDVNPKTGKPFYYPNHEGASQLQCWRKAYFAMHDVEYTPNHRPDRQAPVMAGMKKSTWKEGVFMPSRVCTCHLVSRFKRIDRKRLMEFCVCSVAEYDLMSTWQEHFKDAGVPFAVTDHPPGERGGEAMMALWKERRA